MAGWQGHSDSCCSVLLGYPSIIVWKHMHRGTNNHSALQYRIYSIRLHPERCCASRRAPDPVEPVTGSFTRLSSAWTSAGAHREREVAALEDDGGRDGVVVGRVDDWAAREEVHHDGDVGGSGVPLQSLAVFVEELLVLELLVIGQELDDNLCDAERAVRRPCSAMS